MSDEQSVLVPIREIFADPQFNCRGKVSPIDCTDLANDMKEMGQYHPIMLRPYENPTKPELKYQIVEGFRRFYAARINNWPTISATIRNLSDEEAETINFTENLQRTDLTFMQEVRGLARFGLGRIEDRFIADRLKVSAQWVKVRREAASLPGDVQREIEVGYITQANIAELYKMKDKPDQMYEAVRTIKDGKIKGKSTKVVSEETKKKKLIAKRQRSQNEIYELQDLIREKIRSQTEEIPYEIQTAIRILGWAGGAINDLQIYHDLKLAAERHGLKFERPAEVEELLV